MHLSTVGYAAYSKTTFLTLWLHTMQWRSSEIAQDGFSFFSHFQALSFFSIPIILLISNWHPSSFENNAPRLIKSLTLSKSFKALDFCLGIYAILRSSLMWCVNLTLQIFLPGIFIYYIRVDINQFQTLKKSSKTCLCDLDHHQIAHLQLFTNRRGTHIKIVHWF